MTDSELTLQRRLDTICDDFETDWSADSKTDFDRYLQRIGEDSRERLLRMLVELDVELREHTGQEVLPSDYRELGESIVAHVERLSHDDPLATRSRRVTRRLSRTDRFVQDVDAQDGIYSKGSQVGPYKLLQQIGSGGMGTVWMAEQLQPVRRRVALKLIRNDVGSRETIARFEAERQALAMMDHQHIAKVLDAGTTELGTPFFVMELVKGVPITQFCDDHQLGIKERLELFIPVCKAIQHAHQKGIVHRDLKPSNVLVTMYDGEAVPKVIDFGLAKALEHTTRLTDHTLFTEFGMVVGTLQYMSPEQAEMNALDVDTRTDIYSLGVILYELLTGSTPLDKETMGNHALLQLLTIIKEKEPPRPSLRLSSIREQINGISQRRRIAPSKLQQILRGELDWVVMKALEKDRRRRYETASDFAHDIQRYLSGDAVQARPPSKTYLAKSLLRKHQALVVSIFTVLTLGFAVLTISMWLAHEAIIAKKQAIENRQIADSRLKQLSREKSESRQNEQRAVRAEANAKRDSEKARDSDAWSRLQLARAKWDSGDARNAKQLLYEIPESYRTHFEWGYYSRLFEGSRQTLKGHQGRVFDCIFHPDGKQIFTTGEDGTIRVSNIENGSTRVLSTFEFDGTASLSISDDGRKLAIGSGNGLLRLLELPEGAITFDLPFDRGTTVSSQKISPDGMMIAASFGSDVLFIWSTHDGELLHALKTGQGDITCISFSSNNESVAIGTSKSHASLWDVRTGIQLTTFTEHENSILAIDQSDDGRRIVTASTDGSCWIWDSVTGDPLTSFHCKPQPSISICFSPDGKHVSSLINSSTLAIWDASSAAIVRVLRGHTDTIRSVTFSPKAYLVATASFDGTTKIWDARAEEDLTIRIPSSSHPPLQFSPTTTEVAIARKDRIELCNLFSGKVREILFNQQLTMSSLAFNSKGTAIASGSFLGTVNVWDCIQRTNTHEFKGQHGAILHLKFSPAGALLASSDSNDCIKVWRLAESKEWRCFCSPERVVDLSFSIDGEQLIIITGSGVQRWSLAEDALEESNRFTFDDSKLMEAVFIPARNTFAIYNGRHIAMIDGRSGLESFRIPIRSHFVKELGATHDGQRLCALMNDEQILMWSTMDGRELMSINCGPGVTKQLVLSPNGKWISATTIRTKSRHDDERARFWFGGAALGAYSVERRHETLGQLSFEPTASKDDAIAPLGRVTGEFRNNIRPIQRNKEAAHDSGKVSKDRRWTLPASSPSFAFVEFAFKRVKAEREMRARASKVDISWHRQMALDAFFDERYYEAVFHFAVMVQERPTDARLHDSLQYSMKYFSDCVGLTRKQAVKSFPYFVRSCLNSARPQYPATLSREEADVVFAGYRRGKRLDEPRCDNSTDGLDRLLVLRQAVDRFPCPDAFIALAIAEYRVSNFENAIDASNTAIVLGSELGTECGEHPIPLAILSICHGKAERWDVAAANAKSFRTARKQRGLEGDKECRDFESEFLIQ